MRKLVKKLKSGLVSGRKESFEIICESSKSREIKYSLNGLVVSLVTLLKKLDACQCDSTLTINRELFRMHPYEILRVCAASYRLRIQIIAMEQLSDENLRREELDWYERLFRLIKRVGVKDKDVQTSGSLDPIDNGTFRWMISEKESTVSVTLMGPPMKPEKRVEPLLVHVHLPKNGGSSFKDLLSRSFGSNYQGIYFDDPYARHNYFSLTRVVAEGPSIKAIGSHSIRSFPDLINGRVPLYVCFLRNPAERLISFFRYLQKNWSRLPDEQKRTLPLNIPEMGVAEYVEWQDSLNVKNNITGDRQVYFLTGQSNWDDAAKVLQNFFFVGITERFAESLSVLRYRCSLFGLDLLDDVPVVNATKDHSSDLNNPAVREYLEKHSGDDCLYKWADQNLSVDLSEVDMASISKD